MTTTDKKRAERIAHVVRLREEEKYTYKQIGEAINTCSARARDIYKHAKWVEERDAKGEAGDPYFGLSVRASNCLNNAGLLNRKQIFEAMQAGRLHPRIVSLRNFGWKTYVEVNEWLGLTTPKSRATRACPHCGGAIVFGTYLNLEKP